MLLELGISLVTGGIHITAFCKRAKEYFDVVSIGLAEKSWPNIIKVFINQEV